MRVASELYRDAGARQPREVRCHQRRGAAKEREGRSAHPSVLLGQQPGHAVLGRGRECYERVGPIVGGNPVRLLLPRQLLPQASAGIDAIASRPKRALQDPFLNK